MTRRVRGFVGEYQKRFAEAITSKLGTFHAFSATSNMRLDAGIKIFADPTRMKPN